LCDFVNLQTVTHILPLTPRTAIQKSYPLYLDSYSHSWIDLLRQLTVLRLLRFLKNIHTKLYSTWMEKCRC